MKEKPLALPSSTVFMILLFAAPLMIMVGYLFWQIQAIGQTKENIVKTEQKVQKKEQEVASLQSQLSTLRTIKQTYENYLNKMEREFNEAELNRERLTGYATYPLEKTAYPNLLTDLPLDIETALRPTGVKNLKTFIEESNRSGFLLGTVKAYGTIEQLYKIKIELLRLAYVDSIESSLVEEIANSRHITLKFWIQIL